MIRKKETTYLWIILATWFLVNCITGGLVDLYEDEAYYWMYSKFLDWGYYDHPPIIALLIKLGEFLGKNEFGVRIFSIIISTASIYLIYVIVQPKKLFLFGLIINSFLLLQIVGFTALPDTPFLFFSLLTLHFYKRFTQNDSIQNSLLLGLSIGLMMLSKYLGVLIIGGILLSNFKLLSQWKFYLIGLISFIILLPNVFWQFENQFPSIQYHFIDRSGPGYSPLITLEYILLNLPFIGGILAILFFALTLKSKPKDLFEKALKWNVIFTFSFFLFITFKGQRIEGNWTLSTIVSLIYFGQSYIEQNNSKKWVHTLLYISCGALFIFRIHLITPLFKIKGDRVWDFHGNKNLALEVEKLANNNTILANSFQDASLLNFYLNKPYFIPSLNIIGRGNQYDIWKFDTAFCNQKAIYLSGHMGKTAIAGMNFSTHKVSFLESFSPLPSNNFKIKHIQSSPSFWEVIIQMDQPFGKCINKDSLYWRLSICSTTNDWKDLKSTNHEIKGKEIRVLFKTKETELPQKAILSLSYTFLNNFKRNGVLWKNPYASK